MPYNIKPKMILFDVGGTLFSSSKFSARNGLAALRLAAVNPQDVTDDELAALWDEYSEKIGSDHKSKTGVKLDFPLSAQLKYITMNAGLRFDISIAEQEEIFDRHNSDRQVIDGVPELLDAIHSLGIRTAIISNNAMSGEGLELAIKRWIPNERMEFILTSADLLLTKPCTDIFTAAAKYAHLDPTQCWYCGDSIEADVDGASGVGMTPVLIDANAETPYKLRTDCGKEYLTVNHWQELANHLKTHF